MVKTNFTTFSCESTVDPFVNGVALRAQFQLGYRLRKLAKMGGFAGVRGLSRNENITRFLLAVREQTSNRRSNGARRMASAVSEFVRLFSRRDLGVQAWIVSFSYTATEAEWIGVCG